MIKQSNIGVVQMETDSIISNSRYGIVGNAIEKTENPEIPTRNAKTIVRSEKYKFSRRFGDKTNSKMFKQDKIAKVPITSQATPFCNV